MDDEGDHRAEDPVVRREYDPSSDPADREPTHYTSFDESERAEARSKYGADAQKEKLGAWREKKRRHVSYERQKAKKTKSIRTISVRWYVLLCFSYKITIWVY